MGIGIYMEHLLTNKSVSSSELRNPKAIIKKAGNQPVAILNGNQLEGYFVPASAVGKVDLTLAESQSTMDALQKRKQTLKPILDCLKRK